MRVCVWVCGCVQAYIVGNIVKIIKKIYKVFENFKCSFHTVESLLKDTSETRTLLH